MEGIENLIKKIYDEIEGKQELVGRIRNEFKDKKSNDTLAIKSYQFFDIIDEFEATILQSLQAIRTLRSEIVNLKEKKEKDIGQLFSKEEDPVMVMSYDDISKLNFDYSPYRQKEDELKQNLLYEEDQREINNVKKDELIRDNNNFNPPIINQNFRPNNNMNNLINSQEFFGMNPHMNPLAQPQNYNSFNDPNLNQNINANNLNPNFIHNFNSNNFLSSPVTLPNTNFNTNVNSNLNTNLNTNANVQVTLPEEKNNNNILDEIDNTNTTNNQNQEYLIDDKMIKQSLRQMIKDGKKSVKNSKEPSTYSINQGESQNKKKILPKSLPLNNIAKTMSTETQYSNPNTDRMRSDLATLIAKVSTTETNRMYLADKYGEGDYNTFLSKVASHEISQTSLEYELQVIYDLMKKELLPQSLMTKSQQHSRSGKGTKTRSRIHTQQKNPNVYVEPVQFSNYLRSEDKEGRIQKKSMSFSKEKKYK